MHAMLEMLHRMHAMIPVVFYYHSRALVEFCVFSADHDYSLYLICPKENSFLVWEYVFVFPFWGLQMFNCSVNAYIYVFWEILELFLCFERNQLCLA